jgi:hypothetical protein
VELVLNDINDTIMYLLVISDDNKSFLLFVFVYLSSK